MAKLRGTWNLWAAVGVVAIVVGAFAVGWFQSRERPEETFERGRKALAEGDFRTVRQAARLLDSWPEFRPHSHLLAGGLLVRQGDPAAALAEIEQAAEEESIRLHVLTLSAEAYFHLGRLDDAIKMSRLALDKDPHNADARWWAAASFFMLKDPLRAAPLFLELTEETPEDGRPHRVLGRIRLDQQARKEALVHYTKALERRLPDAERQAVVVEMAETQSDLADFEGALRTLVDAAPSVEVHLLRARCEDDLGRSQAAMPHVTEALKLDPEHVEALMLLGQMRLAQNDAPGAVDVLKQAARSRPRSSLLQYALVRAYTKLGEPKSAALAQEAMDAAKKLEDEYFHAQRRAAENPKDVDIRLRVGDLAEQLGKLTEAYDWYRAAMAVDPAREEARTALQRLSGTPRPANPAQ